MVASTSGVTAESDGVQSPPWLAIAVGAIALAGAGVAVATGAAATAANAIATSVSSAVQSLLGTNASASSSASSSSGQGNSGQGNSNADGQNNDSSDSQNQQPTQMDVSVDSQMESGDQNIAVNKLGGVTDMTLSSIDLDNQPDWDLASVGENIATLGSFFNVQQLLGNGDGEDGGSDSPEQQKRRAALKAKLEEQAEALPGALQDHAMGMVIEKLGEMLEGIEVVGNILVFAWSKSVELADYYNQIKANPGESFAIPLVNHEVVSEHAPSLELKLKEKVIGNLEFGINFGVVVDGVLLEVKEGIITGIKVGSAVASGSLEMMGQSLVEVPPGELTLGTIPLGQGIPLAGIAAPPQSAPEA